MTFSGTTVLKSADLDVAGGEIVGLLGANGSGKSTMVKVLTGVYRPDRGAEILIGGTRRWGRDMDRRVLMIWASASCIKRHPWSPT